MLTLISLVPKQPAKLSPKAWVQHVQWTYLYTAKLSPRAKVYWYITLVFSQTVPRSFGTVDVIYIQPNCPPKLEYIDHVDTPYLCGGKTIGPFTVHTVHFDQRPNYPGVLWPMPQGPENRSLISTTCKQDKLDVLDLKQFIGMTSDESFTHIITHSNPILSRMSRRGSCLLRLNHDSMTTKMATSSHLYSPWVYTQN